MEIESVFFEDEAREGFFVSSMMKRYWAAQMTVMSEVVRICQKYDLQWYAFYGTLLGVVRHEGYIPWDDDFDIAMPRKDYEIFFSVAGKELPQSFVILKVELEKKYRNHVARIVNSHEICTGEEHLNTFHGCPYTAGVDIFPLDTLSDNEEKEEKRMRRCRMVTEALGLIGGGNAGGEDFQNLLSMIEQECQIRFIAAEDIHWQLLLLLDQLFSLYTEEDSKYYAVMFFWTTKNFQRYERKLFAHPLLLPFEGIQLRVPSGYNDILRISYGDYMAIHKAGGIHDYPVYGKQEEKLKKHIGANPYRYTLGNDNGAGGIERVSVKERALMMMDTLTEAHRYMDNLIHNEDQTEYLSLKKSCENLISALWHAAGGKSSAVSPALIEYEKLLRNEWKDGNGFKDLLLRARQEFDLFFTEKKKEILFLPCQAKWWPMLERAWEKYKEDSACEVYVLPIPYARKDDYGTGQGEVCNDTACFPETVVLAEADAYDIADRHPDEIIIQYPYDAYSTILRIPDFFFSENLRKYTDKLVYIPCFDLEDPEAPESKAATAMRPLIEQPAVRYADEVWVPSIRQKEIYVHFLADITGEKEEWENKILVKEFLRNSGRITPAGYIPSGWREPAEGKKKIIFHIDGAFLIAHRDKGISKILDALSIFWEEREKAVCIFVEANDVRQIKSLDTDLWKSYEDLLKEIDGREAVIVESEDIVKQNLAHVDAYYGTPGHIAHLCRNIRIPVMLLNVDCV